MPFAKFGFFFFKYIRRTHLLAKKKMISDDGSTFTFVSIKFLTIFDCHGDFNLPHQFSFPFFFLNYKRQDSEFVL